MIKVTGIDLVKLAEKAYDMSQPVGMGFLHAQPGPLPANTLGILLATGTPNIALRMDYVLGRQCKLTVFRRGDDLYMYDEWYDHSSLDYDVLLTHCGITNRTSVEMPSRY